ncbi:MAG: PD40 domain-containing protein [Sedimentisphaerales bacterium]|nr:PD40 domain-containing protein [Sedimentisphaerales bacterium]
MKKTIFILLCLFQLVAGCAIKKQVLKPQDRILAGTLEIIDVETAKRRIIYGTHDYIGLPTWTPDGKSIVYNKNGRLYLFTIGDDAPKPLEADSAAQYRNKRGLSPDGKTLVYCAGHEGNYDIYTIPKNGTSKTQLTSYPGRNDAPEYSPDGKYIYFNSDRTGIMKIWRMDPDGTKQMQMTFGSEYKDCFARPSPDGETLAFISYDNKPGTRIHPPNTNASLRLMSSDHGDPKILTRLSAVQTPMDAPSWSPDGKKIVFTNYRLVEP